MRRILVATVSAALALGALATPALADTPPLKVQVGAVGFTGNAPDGRFGNAFYPARIAAHPGDRIEFTITSPHTVTFNRPKDMPLPALFPPAGGSSLDTKGQFLNTGFDEQHFVPNAKFTLTLGTSLPAGRYKYICALHYGMTGEIDVLPSSARLPTRDYAGEASRQIARDLAAASRAAEKANDWVEDHPRTVLAGAGTARVSNLRFYPSTITIHVGESITFLKTRDPSEPHTATFGGEPANPFARQPASGSLVFTGSNTVSTGAMLTRAQYRFYIAGALGVISAVTRTTITFSKADTYTYICAIHDRAGMRATVVVTP